MASDAQFIGRVASILFSYVVLDRTAHCFARAVDAINRVSTMGGRDKSGPYGIHQHRFGGILHVKRGIYP